MDVRGKVIIPITKKQVPANFYTFSGLDKDNEHLLIEVKPQNTPEISIPLLRIHSECLTGDVFFSARCDCGNQLNEALESIVDDWGYIAYLRQEGRGIGLYNKLDAYCLQDKGLDTYEANQFLGFESDSRDFSVVSEMLKCLGVNKVRLLTNNPKKVNSLEENDIEVITLINTQCYSTLYNKSYLRSKVIKENHSITVD